MISLVLASLLANAAAPAVAAGTTGPDPAPSSDEEQKKLEEEIKKELGTSGGGGSAAPVTPPAAPSTPSGASQTGGNPFARLLLLPDISAIGSAALAWNHLDVGRLSPRDQPFSPPDTVEPIFQELEVGLQAVVDPYVRADIFLTFDPSGAGVEEAYLTTLSLPASLQIRAGELYAPFGRINQQHGHVWDFVDRPIALARLLAVDGLRGPGLIVSWLAPTSWFAELDLSYQAVAPAFDGDSHVAEFGRLLQFFDVGSYGALGVGFSGAHINESGVNSSRNILGTDLFLKLRPPSSRSYVALQAEALLRQLNGFEAAGGPNGPEAPGTAWGGYAQAVYRDGPFFEYGGRYERAPGVSGAPENRISGLASWLPSEFERIRLEVSYDRLPGGTDGLEALLHLEFIIGSHGAHPF